VVAFGFVRRVRISRCGRNYAFLTETGLPNEFHRLMMLAMTTPSRSCDSSFRVSSFAPMHRFDARDLRFNQRAQFGRLMQGAGSVCGFIGPVYLATHGFPPRSLATAVGFTQCFGMLGGSVGQFAVVPLIHGVIKWQQFWWLSGLVIFLIAVLVFFATPAANDDSPAAAQGSWTKKFAPYKEVLSNPQSYLCGFCAGLLFLPTTIGDMIWGIPFLRGGLDVSYAEAVNRASMVPARLGDRLPAVGLPV
jgi:hypothetical protein